MFNSRNYLTIFFILSIASLVSITACQNSSEIEGDRFNTPIPVVEAIQIEQGVLPLVYRTTGEMRARNQVDIYPEINARITDVLVNDGDRVEQDEPLVMLRDDEVREQLNQAQFDFQIADAQLRQAEARLRRLEAQYDRMRRLADMDLEAQLEIETLQADIDEAEASVDLASSQKERAASQVEERQTILENTVIRAPINGVVGSRNAEVGQRVDSSIRLFQIGDIDNMRIFVTLTERMSNVIEPGSPARLLTLQTGDNNPGLEAVVARISPFLDPVTHTTLAELEVLQNNAMLRPGMFVNVDIVYGESEESLLIPKTALYDHPIVGETGVYLADMDESDQQFENISDTQHQLDEDEELTATADPVGVTFVPVQVLAESGGMAAVRGIDNLEGWVVTVGQNQLAEWESEEAHVRTVDLDYVLELQNLQTRDMESIIFGNSN